MNISCSQCQNLFSITADQLGTRGKCPHCRATIILPKSSKAGLLYDDKELQPPSLLSQHLLCALITFSAHAALMLMMAMLPWGEFSNEFTGEGTLVMIGQLPKSLKLDETVETFDSDEFLTPENEQSVEELDSEIFSPSFAGELAPQSLQDMAFSSSSDSASDYLFSADNESQLLASGEEFSALISRLNKDGLDVVITFDSTGSMQGEINQVKSQINRIGTVLFELIEKTRIGICTYRDFGDEYVVDGLPLTDNLTEIVLYLEKINASGGGDEPEAVEEGLKWATNQSFRQSARKVVLLFGDAPPHPSRGIYCEKISSDFGKRGGILSTVTCRKNSRLADFVRIAKSGRGEAFLTANEREIMAQLIILVFGSQHRLKVVEAFDLLENQ